MSIYKNIMSVGDTLTTCYSMPKLSWSLQSDGLRFLNEYKFCHSFSSPKTFLNLVVLNKLRQNRANQEWWFTMNLLTSLLSALMFVLLFIILARIRRFNRLRSKMAMYLPTSWKDIGNHKAW